ncbi:MAG: sulfurtransferase TusA family protein [Candidatus Marinimicrobia bacterium]|nr:sulfurtransferase TusA family protein [Candidatus Neomarinimicrobiota bacterium]
MNDFEFDRELDCRGLNCPLPVVKTKKQIDTMSTGQTLKLIASDPGSINDMNAWARRTGNEMLGHAEDSGEYIFYIKKT